MAPNRRQPTQVSGEPESEGEGPETTEQRHARLQAALRERRQLQEIEEMERELAGGSPASSGIFGPFRVHPTI
jgi:hypothetical protein